ncbi:HAMP domain-containing histidine kinase [Pseudomonas sp. SbB1]|uniref:histidine kinase n=1 Tax=Pseudomonas putida (strain GB-1) TaxID=76869 RepID=B0KFF7_PSEPG|nr:MULTISPECIES: sensor histidine kinase [Pseudomonas]ABY98880.1 histidine kinase [Pseudomonas putida GB-1]MBP0708912.1 sensor histidine kinase [Pseudomonas sp. T34]MCK2188349.1 sensor histidine kinase [Pseudomonas sp. MB04B]MDD2083964.1 sensor histidine kinase [Pseudomonas putida]MDD2093134.1 sensor histidine kinase [Pseudomonas putida]
MRLYDFIESDMESILQAWENFARSVETVLPPQDSAGLRNHSEKILRTVAADMRTAQTQHQQSEKAQGRGPRKSSKTAAQTHAVTRLIAGFSMDQMVSEYRALRSSVLSRWLAQEGLRETFHIQDMIRFNEAIDQALVESIAAYGQAVESTRKMVLGVLGHDLRSPLGAVLMAGDLILRQDGLDEKTRVYASQVHTSAKRCSHMVDDLLDLARCNLGTGIPIHPEMAELNPICRSVIEELRTAFPDNLIHFNETMTISGLFDTARIAQVFSNLVTNAIRHGDASSPISVTIKEEGAESHVCVHNRGEPIPPEAMPYLFKPEGRYSSYAAKEKGASAGLGLGLFIAAEIVGSHGGRIEVESSAEEGTTFDVILTRSPQAGGV